MATKRRMTPTTKKAPIRCSLVSIAISLDSERGGSEEFTGEWLAARGELRRGAALDDARGEQGRVLEDHGDAERLLLGRDREVAGELETADRDPAGIGTLEADDLAEQHRLPRAALADDREQLAGVDRQIDAAEYLGAAVGAPHAAEVERHAPALWLLRSAGHQLTAKLPRTIRKSKTRIRMKLHTTADVVAVAIPSVPPRVRSPNVHGTTDAIMPNISPFTRPITTSLKCTHSSMRAKYSLVVSLMAGSMATTSAPPHTPMKSL